MAGLNQAAQIVRVLVRGDAPVNPEAAAVTGARIEVDIGKPGIAAKLLLEASGVRAREGHVVGLPCDGAEIPRQEHEGRANDGHQRDELESL